MKKAFTLVELLVVISIMAILTIVTVSQFRTARKRANDVARKGDLNAVAKALQLYFADYGKMPLEYDGKIGNYLGAIEWGDEFKDGTGYTYMIKLPKENTTGNWPQYCYNTDSTQKKYALFAKLEVESDRECDRNNDGDGDFGYVCNGKLYCYANVSPNTSIEDCGNFPGEECDVQAEILVSPFLTPTLTPIPTSTPTPIPKISPPLDCLPGGSYCQFDLTPCCFGDCQAGSCAYEM